MSQPHWPQAAPQQYPPPPAVPVFRVETTRHTGLLVLWLNQTRVVTGTAEQCEAALTSAQRHNLIVGWWSFLSILFMNWLSLLSNAAARAKLRKEVEQAQAYAQWWYQYGQHQNTPPQRRPQ
ncbi:MULTISPECIES: hypothetical protein [Mycolicibacterium]|uniref:Transmembrane protein n=1 Tax=Mycolicibacterium fortuitum TaxID=1766 RepID=A0ABD6QG63_MYCFO|nr:MULTISPECIES: hypothetical protein [Mycolicibacterium]NOP96810.1 hypothetical protein [Mycolicibacterium fortuitum]OBB00752.1 hypothetical protein A5665_20925 [Mycolicibacterium fortuitum]OBI61826.1 hypothetical protein A5666_13600 [Mycolicibacterium fortuitum]OBK03250.1 hypothetical protein A5637_14910 [Mycolicibacterium fortuitum]OMC38041.1 hypothetical protein A5742_07545 [Mycolicibacterium fortuitum]